jgi:hypothetical protein
MRLTDTNIGLKGHPEAPNGASRVANSSLVVSSILFGPMSIIVLNPLINVLDGLPGELQRLFAMSTFVVSRSLQFFPGRLQMAERFLHMGLIFTESKLWDQQHQREDEGGQSGYGMTFHVSS